MALSYIDPKTNIKYDKIYVPTMYTSGMFAKGPYQLDENNNIISRPGPFVNILDVDFNDATLSDGTTISNVSDLLVRVDDTYRKEEADNKYAQKEDLDNIELSALDNYITKDTFDSTIDSIKGNVSDDNDSFEKLSSKITYLSYNYASEDFVNEKIGDLIGTAPETLNTLEEIAEALNDNATMEMVQNAISTKANSEDVYTKTEVDQIVSEVETIKGDKGDKGDPFTYEDFTPEQLEGLKGAQGEVGPQGPQGEQGPKGDTGAQGEKGNPFTYEDFTPEQLEGLKGAQGEKGDQGEVGPQGPIGPTGAIGPKGEQGEKGEDGKSAYELYLDGVDEHGAIYAFESFDKTGEVSYGNGKVEVIEMREDGAKVKVIENSVEGFVGNIYNVNTLDDTQLITLYSEEGLEQDIAVRVTLESPEVKALSQEEWLESLKGAQGEVGPKGDKGDQGEVGPQGPTGTFDSSELENYASKDYIYDIRNNHKYNIEIEFERDYEAENPELQKVYKVNIVSENYSWEDLVHFILNYGADNVNISSESGYPWNVKPSINNFYGKTEEEIINTGKIWYTSIMLSNINDYLDQNGFLDYQANKLECMSFSINKQGIKLLSTPGDRSYHIPNMEYVNHWYNQALSYVRDYSQPKGEYLTEHQSLENKQDTLVSGENIKTINGESILGSGNLSISAGSAQGSSGFNININCYVKNNSTYWYVVDTVYWDDLLEYIYNNGGANISLVDHYNNHIFRMNDCPTTYPTAWDVDEIPGHETYETLNEFKERIMTAELKFDHMSFANSSMEVKSFYLVNSRGTVELKRESESNAMGRYDALIDTVTIGA